MDEGDRDCGELCYKRNPVGRSSLLPWARTALRLRSPFAFRGGTP